MFNYSKLVKLVLFFPVLFSGVLFSQVPINNTSSFHLPQLSTKNSDSNLSGGSEFEVDSLNLSGSTNLRKKSQGSVEYIELDSGTELARNLRSRKDDLGYVSISAFGSSGTEIEVGSVKLRVAESITVPGLASVLVSADGSNWTSTPLNLSRKVYEGNELVSLPVLTIRLDPAAGVFDVYANARMLIGGIAYTPASRDRKFRITAGEQGALLMGLVQSDINPFYVDENNNGVDDDFEMADQGELLASNASRSKRRSLIKAWHEVERLAPPPAIFRQRPRPDGI
jgi:hypothetical protein